MQGRTRPTAPLRRAADGAGVPPRRDKIRTRPVEGGRDRNTVHAGVREVRLADLARSQRLLILRRYSAPLRTVIRTR